MQTLSELIHEAEIAGVRYFALHPHLGVDAARREARRKYESPLLRIHFILGWSHECHEWLGLSPGEAGA